MGMRKKTIKNIISKKFDDWVESIDDLEVRNLVKNNTVITGGCIASMLLGESVNDFDVYFTNKETTLAVANYYVHTFDKIKSLSIEVINGEDGRVSIKVNDKGIAIEGGFKPDINDDPDGIATELENGVDEDESKPKYRPVFLSTNAITLSDKVQIILRFYGSPEELHKNFDFVHCMNYWESAKDGSLTLNPEALEVLLAKELRYIGSRYPLCSVIRTRKFINRGWKINAGQYLKMCIQISELDLLDPEVLQDQLTGVDIAYFYDVIEQVKEKNPDRIDAFYLIEVINRLF